MHPALSVIFFTVTSGAGYGLFAITCLYNSISQAHPLGNEGILLSCAIALGLITFGLISSTFHLANPKNAWRAFSRVRTSWLAREGLLAILFYPIAGLYMLTIWKSIGGYNWLAIISMLSALWAITTIFSTGMIYACLKTIRQWHNALTPINYILLGAMLGGLIFLFIVSMYEPVITGLVVTSTYLIIIAAIAKIVYFFWIGAPAGPTINTATSFTRSMVRLLDVGHTAGTFLTEEFGYEVARARLIALRWLVLLFAFAIPALVLWVGVGLMPINVVFAIAVISGFIGVMIERWLFFAEARHVVNLYHGTQQC
ncbi:MAG: dimethyl sulfoxide reductase anchor subunit family protein [Gammaproteobacteria bacterium]